jgi:NAD(P)-dependent dehydrogenase (short-subunit alcohol dehydrogenase family)
MTTPQTAARTVLVAGAEGSLGFAATQHSARAGLKVAASCRTAADAERVRGQIADAGLTGVTVLTADLADERAVASLIADAERALGRVDALVNAAGGFRWAHTVDTAVADFDFLMSANLRSSFLLAKHVVPGMQARGFGRVVFVSSRATLAPGDPGMGLYTASKLALNALIASLAAEVRKTGVTVNAVLPSTIDTPANRKAMPQSDPADWVTTEALLQLVDVFLGSDGTVLNGALLPVAGRL